MDLADTITPDSTQINADDLIAGTVTVTVEKVVAGSSEQPVDIHLVEFPGRAYRPSKSMRRVLVTAWGPDTSVYIGRRMTLYREPTIRFGKDEVGGIRIAALSDITGPLKVALTVTRGKREPFVVKPLADEPPKIPPATREQMQQIAAALDAAGVEDKLAYVSEQVGRPITSAKDLDRAEAAAVITALTAQDAAETLDLPEGDAE